MPQMVEVIHWCIELGVKHITVYAFSIDNFKRSPDEVEALMHLAEQKYIELARVRFSWSDQTAGQPIRPLRVACMGSGVTHARSQGHMDDATEA